MTKSRWARASREDLEALAAVIDSSFCEISNGTILVLERLRASCPPLRTEAEVAAEALAVLRAGAAVNAPLHQFERLCARAKEPTR